MKILVGSQNPVKIEAAKEAFSEYFENIEVIGMNIDSGVSDQPVNDETFEGARNRAVELKRMNDEKNLGAKFFIGIEGGIINLYSKWFAFGCMCVIDLKGRIGFGTSPHFELPGRITNELLNGTELGDIMDRITGDDNTKQKGGAIDFFTKGKMDRKHLYIQGLIVALIPFVNDELYFEN